MNLLKLLIIIFAFLFLKCNGQNNESYWISESVYKINREPMHGVTLGFMQAIAEQELHLIKKGDSLIFNYPFERKVKISELKSISNFDLLPDSDEKFDSVYNVNIEKGKLKIKFKYSGTSSDNKNFVINFKKLSKKEYFLDIEKTKMTLKYLDEKINPFIFNRLSLNVAKPEYFNETDLGFLGQKNKNVDVSKPGLNRFDRNWDGEETYTFDISGLAVNFYNSNKCAAKYKSNCFQGVEYLLNEKDDRTSAIILSKEKKQTKLEIVRLFNEINADFKNADFLFWRPILDRSLNGIFCTWITDSEIITLTIEDYWYFKEPRFNKKNKTKKYYQKVFDRFINSINESKISVYIISKQLDEELRISRSGSSTSGKIINYGPYDKNYR